MAGSPTTRSGSSPTKPPTNLEKIIAEAVVEGIPLHKLASKLHKKTGRRDLKYWRYRVRYVAARSQHVREEVFLAAKGDGIMALGASVNGVAARASRGRVDAAKLLWSMTGFHNDRVQHDHSGNIEISVSIPRPQATEDHIAGPGKIEEGFVDADVVDD
jgi:hypothetical protein